MNTDHRNRVHVEIDDETDYLLSSLKETLHERNKAEIIREAVKVFAGVLKWQRTGEPTEIVVTPKE